MPLVVILAVAAAPLPWPNPNRDPAAVLRRLAGLYEVTSYETLNGQKLNHGSRMFVKIADGMWSLQREQPDGSLQKLNHLTLVLDPKQKPGWFDFKNRPEDANLFLAGVYESVSRDELRIVYASPPGRPRASSATRDGEFLMVLRRAKR